MVKEKVSISCLHFLLSSVKAEIFFFFLVWNMMKLINVGSANIII